MSVRVVIDTNVLVYSQDADEGAKHRTAVWLLDRLQGEGGGVLTTQVLGEFFSVVTRRFKESMGEALALEHTRNLSTAFQLIEVSLAIVIEAMRGTIRYRMHYYDAQIWAAARLNGIGIVLSEDFEHGREIEGVRFYNPFAEGFDLAMLAG